MSLSSHAESAAIGMALTIRVPSAMVLNVDKVSRIFIETTDGTYGLVPDRQSWTTALVPGLLSYRVGNGIECYVAIGGGLLVRADGNVRVLALRTACGLDIERLHAAVDRFMLDGDGDGGASR